LVLSSTVGSISWTSTGSGTNLTNFFPQNNLWSPKVVLRNYGETSSVTLEAGSIVLNYAASRLDFTITYDKALSALGMVDPGTWALYASKTENGIESLVELASGNLQIKLY
jgi:hypothetical protein